MSQICCNQDCNQGRDCPLRTKTLTDEEIDKLWHSDEFYEEWTDGSISAIHYNKFARAILKKASEK